MGLRMFEFAPHGFNGLLGINTLLPVVIERGVTLGQHTTHFFAELSFF